MTKQLLTLAVLSLMSGSVYAQNNLETELDSEINQLSAGANEQGPQVATGTPSSAAIAPNGSVNGGQPIYILNQATPTSNAQVQTTQVQKQPQVDIMAAPLQKSRAEQIRDARQQVEVETENRIVEKLEMARIEDEKRRAGMLFGDAFNQMGNQQNNIQAQNVNVNPQPQPQPQQQVIPVQPVQVLPTVQQVDEENTRDIIREELRAALKSEEELPVEPTEERYFSGILGIGEYPDVTNVRGNYMLGASFGTKFDGTYAVEGTFTYGNFSVDQIGGGYYDSYYGYYIPRTVDVNQYSGSLAVKYLFFNGMVKPVFGGLVQYSYRTFNWSENQAFSGYNNNGQTASSHAIDVGVVTGADIEFSSKFSLGLDFRYMWNMSSRVDAGNKGNFLSAPSYGTPIEKLQYYTMSLVGRVTF